MFKTVKISHFLDRVSRNLGFSCHKLLNYYAYVLMITAILAGMMLYVKAQVSQIALATFLAKDPALATQVIIVLTDLIIGYYCLVNQKVLLKNAPTYKYFMLVQCISQVLVGNIFALVLAVFAVRNSDELVEGKFNSQALFITILSAVLLVSCFILLVVIQFKG